MRNVGEGATMDQRGIAFQGLDEIGQHGVFQQGHHGANGVHFLGSDRHAPAAIADDHAFQPVL